MRPDKLTLGGEMQKIRCCFKRKIANATPQLIAAGRAGGTQMTIRFKNRSMNVLASMPLRMKLPIRQINPMIAMQAIKRTNFIASA
jgi:hypothetical protein